MYKVLVFAGTIEGRSTAEYLAGAGVPVLVSVATEYGASLMKESDCLQISSRRLDEAEMAGLIQADGCELVIDATHPYAAEVSVNIRRACEKTGKEYIRLLRASEETLVSGGQEGCCIAMDSMQEAVEYLKQTEGRVLITTGSKDLAAYTEIPDFAERLYPRFLPAPGAVEKCLELGYRQKNLICMQGPFSVEMNKAMLKQTGASWMVTKESGKAGGFVDKVKAAREAGARLLVIGRPVVENGLSGEQVCALLAERFGIEQVCTEQEKKAPQSGKLPDTAPRQKTDGMLQTDDMPQSEGEFTGKRQVTLIGIGMGSASNMTIEAMKDCEEADAILGASRMLECCSHLDKPVFAAYKDEELKAWLDAHPAYRKAVILLSGDIGFYSGAKKLIGRLEPDYEVKTRSGISSVVYFCGKLKTSWEDVKLMSLHGKSGNLTAAAARYKKVFSLIGGKNGVSEACRMLTEYGLGNVKVSVGIRLSYPDEQILVGTAQELAEKSLGGLSVILVENPEAGQMPVTHGIEDDAFIRAKVPMTKSEVRSISLSKLQLHDDSVMYDVGAGTGSVSIEAALQSPEGYVYAIEKKEEACALIEENKRKFHAANIEVVSGLAPEALTDLPVPTHAFIGGSSGNMKEILELLLRKNPRIRVVINCIALESVSETLDCVKSLPVCDVDIIHVSSARSRELGRYHMMTGMNPIYIVSFTGAAETKAEENKAVADTEIKREKGAVQ
ncbi:MAG: precorrin-6A reductase [Lachnospiraceae bacterium]|nr:precorrin-6A reductase [Lachnospiraceae bacterium]